MSLACLAYLLLFLFAVYGLSLRWVGSSVQTRWVLLFPWYRRDRCFGAIPPALALTWPRGLYSVRRMTNKRISSVFYCRINVNVNRYYHYEWIVSHLTTPKTPSRGILCYNPQIYTIEVLSTWAMLKKTMRLKMLSDRHAPTWIICSSKGFLHLIDIILRSYLHLSPFAS